METDYITFTNGEWEGRALVSFASAIEEALVHPAVCTPMHSDGRGHLLQFEYGDGAGLIRPYLRGGVVRYFSKDRYYGENRPLAELEVHCRAQAMGLAVPLVLGVVWRRTGAWYSGSIATEDLACPNLHQWLPGKSEADEVAMMKACGALIRAMHDGGIWHADLQIKNVLVHEGVPKLIDFDGAQWQEVPWSKGQCMRNLLRFRRSLEKNGHDDVLFDALCVGYGAEAGVVMRGVYGLKGRISDWMQGRKK